jgi:hypothetical protein
MSTSTLPGWGAGTGATPRGVARARRVASSERTGTAAARFAAVLLFEGVALVRFAAFGFDRRAPVARAGFATLGFFRRAPLGFFGETFRFARRAVRAALRFGRAALLRFATAAFPRPFFFATRFVVFRFMRRLLLLRHSWPPGRQTHPRTSYAIPLRFPTRRSSRILARTKARQRRQLSI